MLRCDDDIDEDDDEDDFDEDDEDGEGGDEDDEDEEGDEDEPETWQVGGPRVLPAKSWHRLTSGFELPRLAAVFQLSVTLEAT